MKERKGKVVKNNFKSGNIDSELEKLEKLIEEGKDSTGDVTLTPAQAHMLMAFLLTHHEDVHISYHELDSVKDLWSLIEPLMDSGELPLGNEGEENQVTTEDIKKYIQKDTIVLNTIMGTINSLCEGFPKLLDTVTKFEAIDEVDDGIDDCPFALGNLLK